MVTDGCEGGLSLARTKEVLDQGFVVGTGLQWRVQKRRWMHSRGGRLVLV